MLGFLAYDPSVRVTIKFVSIYDKLFSVNKKILTLR
jgi:hypothetical protein